VSILFLLEIINSEPSIATSKHFHLSVTLRLDEKDTHMVHNILEIHMHIFCFVPAMVHAYTDTYWYYIPMAVYI